MPRPTPLIRADQIHRRVVALGRRIGDELAERELIVVPLLGGAFCFVADLVRQIHHPGLRLHFAAASSYHGGRSSSGQVTVRDLPPTADKDFLVVDDILDTGRTLQAVTGALVAGGAASVRSCVLLDKPARRAVPIRADYVGFTIPDRFVVGYGLDHEDRWRHLPDVCVLDQGGPSPPSHGLRA